MPVGIFYGSLTYVYGKQYVVAFFTELDELLPLEDYDSAEESPFPTLEEAAEMAKEAAEKAHKGGRKFTKANQVGKIFYSSFYNPLQNPAFYFFTLTYAAYLPQVATNDRLAIYCERESIG